jgi:hypothetical protein
MTIWVFFVSVRVFVMNLSIIATYLKSRFEKMYMLSDRSIAM